MPSITVQPTAAATATTRFTGDSAITGNAWGSTGSITAEDDSGATNTGGLGQGRYLIGSDFRSGAATLAATIAAGATITGVTGRYRRQKTSGSGVESGCVLRTSAGLVSSEMNNSSAYPGSWADRTFTATFTGTTADVRDSTFGLSVRNSGISAVAVDVMELTVSYLNPPALTPTATPLAYTEGDAPTAVDPGLTVTADVTNLTGATAQITTGFAAEDTLAFVTQNGISGSWNAGTGTMTLTGTATVAQYEAAIRSVTYSNGSTDPSVATRVVTFGATDGTRAAAAVTRSITITAIDDVLSPPTASYIAWAPGGIARADAVIMPYAVANQASDYLATDSGPVQIRTANIDLPAFSGSSDLIAAIAGKSIAVVSLSLVAGTATAAYFLDTDALMGGASGPIQMGLMAFVLEFNPNFWMRTGVGAPLRINLGTQATMSGVIQYAEMP